MNAGKSEVSTFSKDTEDAKHHPTILVGAKAIKLNPTLGCSDMDEVTRRIGPSFRVTRAISHSEWGCPKKNPRAIYYAFFNGHLGYAGAG